MLQIYTPGKRQKMLVVWRFSEGIEIEHWAKMD